MAITVSDFRARFPEFSDVVEYPDATINLYISDTVIYMGSDANWWSGETKYNYAQSYLTAHLLYTFTNVSDSGDAGSISGQVNTKVIGSTTVVRSVATKARSDEDDFFVTTAYGQQYIIIRNKIFQGIAATEGYYAQ